MSGVTVALIGTASLLLLLFIRMPVGSSLMLVGAVGIYWLRPQASLPVVAGEIFNQASNYSLTILPLFILMGNLAAISGMSRELYSAAHGWFGHLRGGLAMTTIASCAGFSALSGSSLAAALTMGRVSLPEMKRLKYDDALSTGTVAAGGTLGILIPPSAGFILYAILTEESIGKLFIAGILPGLMLALLFMLTIWLLVFTNPAKAPRSTEVAPLSERLILLGRAGWILCIVFLTIGGIYFGIFSVIEAAGIGAFLALLVTIVRRKLNWANIRLVITNTLKSTCTVFMILFGAFVFKTFISLTQVTPVLTQWVETQGFTAMQVVIVIVVACSVIGTFLVGFAILVLAIPFVQPILQALNVDLIWFGVLFVVIIEMALISPPVGLNVFVVKSIAPGISLETIFRGIFPFWLAMIVAVVFLLWFPEIALILPSMMSE